MKNVVGVLGVCGLSDLELEKVVVQAVSGKDSVQCLLQSGVKDIDAREVHGNRKELAKTVTPIGDLGCGFVPHIFVQKTDLAVLFQKRDEISRRNHTQIRVVPAHQSLRAHKGGSFRLDVEFGLEVDLELLGIQSVAQVVYQALLIDFSLADRLVVDDQMLFVMTSGNVACRVGPVEELHRLDLWLIRHDTHSQKDVGVGDKLVHRSLKIIQYGVVVRNMIAVDVEPVGFEPACDTFVLAGNSPDFVSQMAKHDVAQLPAVKGIDGVELFDVQDYCIHRRVGMLMVETVGILEEVFSV